MGLEPAGTVVSPEQQTICAVALADDGVPAEHQRRRTLLGPRQLAEDDPHHARLDHHPHDRLGKVIEVAQERGAENSKQLDPSSLWGKTRYQCQDCVAAFLKVTLAPALFFFHYFRTHEQHFHLRSTLAKLRNKKFWRKSRANASCYSNWILSSF